MSTLLSDLDGAAPNAGSDGDLVNQILREMNTSSGAIGPPPPMPGAPPPPTPASFPGNPGMISAPSSNTAVNQHLMEMNPATSHVINGTHPTAADFASSMNSAPYASAAAPPPAQKAYEYPKRTWSKRITEELKTPILVALLVFIFSLPVVNFLFAHYLPRMVLPTGQLNTIGLLVKSVGAGAMFWLLQRVIVPLFSM